jgi:hypothetical protein
MPAIATLQRQALAKYWEYPGSFATTLLAMLIDDYSTDAMSWEPETIRLQIKDTYDVEIPQVNMDKLLGLVSALTTNLFYTSVDTFVPVSNALNDSEVNFLVFDPVEPDEAAWAITEVMLNDPPSKTRPLATRFSEPVRKYIGVSLEIANIDTPPDVLKIAIRPTALKTTEQTFADDPILFAAGYKRSQKQAEEIIQYMRNRAAGLLGQLTTVPLQYRDGPAWNKFVSRARKGLQQKIQ